MIPHLVYFYINLTKDPILLVTYLKSYPPLSPLGVIFEGEQMDASMGRAYLKDITEQGVCPTAYNAGKVEGAVYKRSPRQTLNEVGHLKKDRNP